MFGSGAVTRRFPECFLNKTLGQWASSGVCAGQEKRKGAEPFTQPLTAPRAADETFSLDLTRACCSDGVVLTLAERMGCLLVSGKGTPPQGLDPGVLQQKRVQLWMGVFREHLFWGQPRSTPMPSSSSSHPSLARCSWEEIPAGAPSRLKSTCGRCGVMILQGLLLRLGALGALIVA